MAKNKIKFSEDKKYHKWRRIGFYCLYAAIALAVVCIVLGQVFGMDSKPCLYSGYAAIVLVIWFYLINFFKWRCPNCRCSDRCWSAVSASISLLMTRAIRFGNRNENAVRFFVPHFLCPVK